MVSGGFQDAYTYNTREGGLPMPQPAVAGADEPEFYGGQMDGRTALSVPAAGVAFGVFLRSAYRGVSNTRLHWRQGILLLEIVILFAVGFIPQEYNMAATVLVSFACAMQVQTFRKVNGYSMRARCALAMCGAHGGIFHVSAGQDRKQLRQSLYYFESFSSLRSEPASAAICPCATVFT